jgi:hypothetical protein
MLHSSLKRMSLSVASAIAAICPENPGLQNEDAFYTAVEQISLQLHHILASRESSANDNFPMPT